MNNNLNGLGQPQFHIGVNQQPPLRETKDKSTADKIKQTMQNQSGTVYLPQSPQSMYGNTQPQLTGVTAYPAGTVVDPRMAGMGVFYPNPTPQPQYQTQYHQHQQQAQSTQTPPVFAKPWNGTGPIPPSVPY